LDLRDFQKKHLMQFFHFHLDFQLVSQISFFLYFLQTCHLVTGDRQSLDWFAKIIEAQKDLEC